MQFVNGGVAPQQIRPLLFSLRMLCFLFSQHPELVIMDANANILSAHILRFLSALSSASFFISNWHCFLFMEICNLYSLLFDKSFIDYFAALDLKFSLPVNSGVFNRFSLFSKPLVEFFPCITCNNWTLVFDGKLENDFFSFFVEDADFAISFLCLFFACQLFELIDHSHEKLLASAKQCFVLIEKRNAKWLNANFELQRAAVTNFLKSTPMHASSFPNGQDSKLCFMQSIVRVYQSIARYSHFWFLSLQCFFRCFVSLFSSPFHCSRLSVSEKQDIVHTVNSLFALLQLDVRIQL